MRAFTLDSFEAQPALRNDIPEPHIGDNELRVRVHASSINPVDVFIAAGALKETAEHEFPVTLGRDFAGIVDQVGSGVSRYGLATRSLASSSMPTPPCTTGAGPS